MALPTPNLDDRTFELGLAGMQWLLAPENALTLWIGVAVLMAYLIGLLLLLRRDRLRMQEE